MTSRGLDQQLSRKFDELDETDAIEVPLDITRSIDTPDDQLVEIASHAREVINEHTDAEWRVVPTQSGNEKVEFYALRR